MQNRTEAIVLGGVTVQMWYSPINGNVTVQVETETGAKVNVDLNDGSLFEGDPNVEGGGTPAELPDPGAAQPPAHHAGAGDTEVSAAVLALPKAGTLRWKVLDALFVYASGLTDRELAERTGTYLYSIAPRRTELVRMGWVEDTGRRRPTGHGEHLAAVWALTDAGAARMGDYVGAPD